MQKRDGCRYMVIYYIDFKGLDEEITIVYDTKRHRYAIGFFGREKEVELSKKQGEAILHFLKFIAKNYPDFIEIEKEYEGL